MSPRQLQACEIFQPAEKACWEILLREYPNLHDISLPVLDAAMDRTLQQLWSILGTDSIEDWLRAQDNIPPLSSNYGCALNVLLPYFDSGRRALELISHELGETEPVMPEDERARLVSELCSAFKLLVHWQLQGSCSQCHQAGLCRFGDKPAGAAQTDTNISVAKSAKSPPSPKPHKRRTARASAPDRASTVSSEVDGTV